MPALLRIEMFASISSGVTLELAPGAKTMLLSPFSDDYDHGYAGSAIACRNSGYVNSRLLKMNSEFSAERIIPQAPDQSHGVAEPGDSDGLVRTFSAGMNLKVGSDDGLAYGGNPCSDCYQVCIDAADDDNWLLRRQCSFSSKITMKDCHQKMEHKRLPSSRTERR